MERKVQRGMTLLELLVVVAIIGLISAIGIWNYFVAITKAKQKRTMADMRSVATAWELYAQDTESYIPAAAVFTFPTTVVTPEQLELALSPSYIKNFPKEDGWKTPFDFAIEGTEEVSYAIRSRGADGLVDDSYEEKMTTSFNNDIVFSNGQFVVWPNK